MPILPNNDLDYIDDETEDITSEDMTDGSSVTENNATYNDPFDYTGPSDIGVPDALPVDPVVPESSEDRYYVIYYNRGDLTDYEPAYLQELAEAGCKFYAIYDDETEVEIQWTDIEDLDPLETEIDLSEAIASASNQHFWDDTNGVHVSEVAKEDWQTALEANFADLSSSKNYYNILMNSLGLLLRRANFNLTSINRAAISFYDGLGNDSVNVMASFGRNSAQIGRSTDKHVVINDSGLTAYNSDGSLAPLTGTFDGANINNSSITNAKIVDGTITGTKIANATIDNSNIKNGTIEGTKIASATIDNSNIKNGTIEGTKIKGGTITGSLIADGTIEDTDIKNGTITGTKIASATIDNSNIKNGTITGTKIASATIENSNIKDGTITGTKIQGSTLTDIPYAGITDADIEVARVANAEIDKAKVDYAHITNGVIDNAKIDKADVNGLAATYATITNLNAATARIDDLEADHVSVEDFEAEQANIDNLQAATADIETIRANSAKVANLTAGELEADHATVGNLSATYATIDSLDAAEGRIGTLETENTNVKGRLTAAEGNITTLNASKANVADLTAATGRISDLESTRVRTTDLEANYITADTIESTYTKTDFSNTDVAWIQNGVIKDGSISSAMINSVSANKLTAGTINGSVINVTNLNADNITAGTINGQRIGEGSLSLDKLSEDVYTESEVDAKLSTMQSQIDGAIETWTGTAVPTLQNSPASSWNTTALKDSHVGDVYFVVNSNSQQNGYNYRFTKSGSTYSWQLIKDSDVTNALQRISTAEGKITTFDSDISQLKTDTGTLTTKTTSLETRMSNAEDDILDKVDTTTFNEVSDTVDSHSRSISQMSTTLSNKADSSTVSAVTQRVSKNEQDISGINTTIGELQTTVASKADGSTVETMSTKLNTVSDTVDGHTQSISNINSTLETKADSSTVSTLTTKVNNVSDTVDGHTQSLQSITQTQTSIQQNAVKSTVQLWFTKANATAPAKPTAHITTNNAATGNAWNLAVPTYNSAYPNYYYCYEYQYVDGSYGWSAVTRDIATGEMQERARTAIANAANAQADIDGLEIGGRNLLVGTSNNWTEVSLSTSRYFLEVRTDYTLEIGQTYTFSIIVEKVSSDNVPIHLHIGNGNRGFYSHDIDAWRKNNIPFGEVVSITHTVTEADLARSTTDTTIAPYFSYRLRNEKRATTIRYRNVKLEKGNRATDWTPAPEDVDADISTAQTSADNAQATANKNIKESQQLWFTKANGSAPNKPTAKVTSTSTSGNAWTTKVPTYNASYPHYFYCMQYIAADGTVTWSDVVYDQATTEAQSVARTTSTNLSTLQQDYATFKQTTQNFESTIGTTYATKTEVSAVDDKIDNLEIGRRNLLKDSLSIVMSGSDRNWHTDSYTPMYKWTYSNVDDVHTYAFSAVSGATETMNNAYIFVEASYSPGIEEMRSREYAWGLDIKVDGVANFGNAVRILFDIDARPSSTEGSHVVTLSPSDITDGVWTHIGACGVVGESDTESLFEFQIIGLGAVSGPFTISYRRPIVVYGNAVPQDWTPAPEDVDASIAAVPRMSKINMASRNFTTNQWKNFGSRDHVENWTTGASYNNSHLRIGDRAYMVGTISDQNGGTATIIGEVTNVQPSGSGTSYVTLKSEQLIFGGDVVSAIESRVSSAETSITQTNQQIVLKANASDVYTKTQVDGKITQEVNDRNSAIEQSASAINLSVSQNYTTKTEAFGDLALYTPVEWLQGNSDRTSRIDTGYVVKTWPVRMRAVVLFPSLPTGEQDFWGNFAGGGIAARFVFGTYSSKWYMYSAAAKQGPDVSANVKYDVSIEYDGGNAALIVDGDRTEYATGTSAPSTTATNHVGLFSGRGDDRYLSHSTARIYEAQFYEADALLFDFVPVKRISDSALGMLNLVNRTFHPCIGGAFTAGEELSWIEVLDQHDRSRSDYDMTRSQAEFKVTTDGITSTVSKISSAKYLETSYQYALSSIRIYAAENYTGTWAVTDTKDTKVGDTVYLKVKDSTRNCNIYIKATVTAVSGKNVTCTSHGYEDVLPVDTIKSTINQSSDSVKIQAKHVEIDGAAIFSNSAFKAAADAAYDAKGSAASLVAGGDNLIGRFNFVGSTEATYNHITGTLTSTTTTNTANSTINLQTFSNTTFVKQIVGFDTSYVGKVCSYTFEKESTFNRISLKFNGNKIDARVIWDISSVANGTELTLSFRLDSISSDGKGNGGVISGINLRTGNIPSRWSLAPEDEVVGGRNFLLNTENPTALKPPKPIGDGITWQGSAGGTLSFTSGVMKFTSSSTSGEHHIRLNTPSHTQRVYESMGVDIHDSLVLSGFVRASMSASDARLVVRAQPSTGANWLNTITLKNLRTGAESTDTSIVVILTGSSSEWIRFEVSIYIPESVAAVNAYFSFQQYGTFTVGDTFEFKRLKLERGTRATDWSPAPEDVDANISSAETSAKGYADTKKSEAISAAATDATNKANAAQSAAISAAASDATSKANAAEANAKGYAAEQASETYEKIRSQGIQLVTNGNGFMGDNTNFSWWTFDGSKSNGSPGSFTHAPYAATIMTDEMFPVDTAKDYLVEFDAFSTGSGAHPNLYAMLTFYDVDKKLMNIQQVSYIIGSTTTLARELKNGDTVIYLTDASGFIDTSAAHQRSLIFWDYTNSFGYTYPPETYSRNFYAPSNGLWSDYSKINKSNNTITLTTAWTGGTKPAGTYLSQNSSGSTYAYFWCRTGTSFPLDEWTHVSSVYSGFQTGIANVAGKFYKGCSYCKIGWLWNYQNSSSNPQKQIWITNVSVKEAVATKAELDSVATTANNAAPKSSAVAEEQYIYRSAASGTTSMSGTTSWIAAPTSATASTQNAWTTKRPEYSSSYPVLFVAKQRKMVNGTVTCTTPVKDDTTTIIDGGHITTGTIDTNRLNADTIKSNIVQTTELNADKITSGTINTNRLNAGTIRSDIVQTTELNADKITSGTIAAARIAAGSIAVGKIDASSGTFNTANIPNLSADKITSGSISADRIKGNVISAVNNGTGTINADKINVSGLTIGYSQIDDTPTIPTKVSDLTNDSGFQNATQVNSAITSKGYQTSSQVETAITNKGYQTSSQVETAITNKGYQTSSQVETAIASKGYATTEQAQGYANAKDSAIAAAAKRTDVSIAVTAINYDLGTATLQATLYIDGTATTSGVTYKWLKDGAVISGQTARTLSITAAMGLSHVYSCTVTYS